LALTSGNLIKKSAVGSMFSTQRNVCVGHIVTL